MTKRTDIDEVVREMSEDAVTENPDFVSTPDVGAERGPVDEEEQLADIFSHVPADQGFFLKIYRRKPVPAEYGNRPVFVYDIQQPDLIPDIESEVFRLAKINGWPDGLYEAKLFQQGVPGVTATRRLAIQVPKVSEVLSNGVPSQPLSGHEAVLSAARLIKEFGQTGSSGGTPDALIKAVADIYRTANVAEKSPVPQLNVLDMIRALKELAPAPAPQGQTPNVIETLKIFASMQKNDDDFLIKLTRLKEAGLIPSPQTPVDPNTQLTKTLELMAVIIPLIQSMGGEGAGSIGQELVRTLGPQVSKIIADITGTVNNVVSAKVNIPKKPRPEISQIPTPPGEQPEGSKGMLPVFRELKNAIEVRDINFYEKLQELLQQYGNPQMYDDLLEGKVTMDSIIAYVKPLGADFLETPEANTYLSEFLLWARNKKAAEIVMVCGKCKEEYVFESQAQVEAEGSCPTCHEPLILLPVEEVGPSVEGS